MTVWPRGASFESTLPPSSASLSRSWGWISVPERDDMGISRPVCTHACVCFSPPCLRVHPRIERNNRGVAVCRCAGAKNSFAKGGGRGSGGGVHYNTAFAGGGHRKALSGLKGQASDEFAMPRIVVSTGLGRRYETRRGSLSRHWGGDVNEERGKEETVAGKREGVYAGVRRSWLSGWLDRFVAKVNFISLILSFFFYFFVEEDVWRNFVVYFYVCSWIKFSWYNDESNNFF